MYVYVYIYILFLCLQRFIDDGQIDRKMDGWIVIYIYIYLGRYSYRLFNFQVCR